MVRKLNAAAVKWITGISSILILLGLSQVPINQWRVLSFGIDDYENHLPLFGSHKVTQTIDTTYPLTGLGFILVDLHRQKEFHDIVLTITDPATQQLLAQTSIPGSTIKDDKFTRFVLTTKLNNSSPKIAYTLEAPGNNAATAIGVRFETRDVLALEVRERAPAWMIVSNALKRHHNRWPSILVAILVNVLIVTIAFRVGWNNVSKKGQLLLEWLVIAILLLGALWPRLSVMSHLGGASGGDPYNYLFIAQSIQRGENPLVSEKRLPGFPFLLVPSLLSKHIDQVSYMRSISIVSALISLFLLWKLSRVLKLPWAVQIAAPALIAWQKDFFWTSIRPEPYTFYTALVLGILILFFSARTWWQQLLYAFLLGYAAMTRQEGFILAAVIGILSLVNWRTYTSSSTAFFSKATLVAYTRLYLPALLLVLPFFLHNTVSYGNPFFTPYFEGDRLQIVDSWGAFTDSLGATWGIIGSLWRPAWESLERYKFSEYGFLTGFFGVLLWLIAWQRWYQTARKRTWISTVCLSVVLSASVAGLALASASFNSVSPAIIAGLTLASSLGFIWLLRWPGASIFLVVLSQIAVATWFHPFAKHYQQSLPLIALAIITVILAPLILRTRAQSSDTGSRYALASSLFALMLPFAILTTQTLFDVNTMIDKHNANSALDSVLYRAVKAALRLPGPYGADQGYIQARLYFDEQGRYYLGENSTVTQEEEWIKNNNVQVMITTNDGDAFTHPHPTWQKVASFKSEGKDEKLYESFVYLIPTP